MQVNSINKAHVNSWEIIKALYSPPHQTFITLPGLTVSKEPPYRTNLAGSTCETA